MRRLVVILLLLSLPMSLSPQGTTRGMLSVVAKKKGGGAPPPALGFNDLANASSTSNASSYSTGTYQPTANALVLAVVVNTDASPGATPSSFAGNGLTWVLVDAQAYNTIATTVSRISIWRAQGASPTSTVGTVDFSGNAQTGCMIRVVEFTNADTSRASGAGAIVQVVGNALNATANPTLTLSALTGSANAVLFAYGDDVNSAADSTPETDWNEVAEQSHASPSSGLTTMYRLATTDNTPTATATSRDWGAIAIEITAADVSVPTLTKTSVNVAGTGTTLTFSEPVSKGGGYTDQSDLDLDGTTTGNNKVLTYLGGDGTTVLTFTNVTMTAGETIDLDFTGAANSLEDQAGNDLASISSGTVINNTGGIEADMLVDGEDSTDGITITTTILDNMTHVESGAAAGSWSLGGSPGSNIQVDNFEQALLNPFYVNATTYADASGTRGIQSAVVNPDSYFRWSWTTDPDVVAVGCWIKTPATASGFTTQDFLILKDTGGDNFGFQSGGTATFDVYIHYDESGFGTTLVASLAYDTVYWFALVAVRNGDCKGEIFNTSGVSLGSATKTNTDDVPWDYISFGQNDSSSVQSGDFFRFDDIVMEIGNAAAHPLGPNLP